MRGVFCKVKGVGVEDRVPWGDVRVWWSGNKKGTDKKEMLRLKNELIYGRKNELVK